MKIAVICAPGIGDALIMHIVSHQLSKLYDVTTVTRHDFGNWFDGYRFATDMGETDAIFLQHDNSPRAKKLHSLEIPVYTFYGSHLLAKHGPLRGCYDYVCDSNRNMVDNVVTALKTLFKIPATSENGFKAPPGLIHRRHKKRVAIHTTSAMEDKNWPSFKFRQVAAMLESLGYEPAILPLFNSISDLSSYIYESGFFLGVDSGPGHIASLLKIPHLIIGREERQMALWQPGWMAGEIVVPPSWIPNWKGFRLREHNWKSFVTTKEVINRFKQNVLNN